MYSLQLLFTYTSFHTFWQDQDAQKVPIVKTHRPHLSHNFLDITCKNGQLNAASSPEAALRN